MMRSILVMAWLVIGVIAISCGAPGSAAPLSTVTFAGPSESPAVEPAPVKHITMGATLESNTRPNAQGAAGGIIQPLVQSGLTVVDGQGVRHAVLAETVPSLEN